jgi:hypothetical protein
MISVFIDIIATIAVIDDAVDDIVLLTPLRLPLS